MAEQDKGDVLIKAHVSTGGTSDASDLDEISAGEQFERLTMKAYERLDWCKSADDRRRAELRWEDAQNFHIGKHWLGVKSYGIPGRSADEIKLHACPVENYFKAFIEGIVGDITDRPVDIQVKARTSDDETIASAQNDVSQYIWYINNGDRKLEFIVRRAALYGSLIAKVYWDPTWLPSPQDPYRGNVRFFGVLPTNLFIDPRIHAVDSEAIQQGEFVIYGVRRSLAYVRQQYPERGYEVTADTYAGYVTTLTQEEDSDIYVDDMDVLVMEYWYKGDPLAPDFPEDTPEMVEEGMDNTAVATLDDESRKPLEIESPAGRITRGRKMMKKGKRPAPPSGREGWVHKAVIAGNILLEHRTYVYPEYPFVMDWFYPSDESIYGYGDAHDMVVPQLIINKLAELSIEGAALQSYGNWLTEEGNIRNKALFQRYAGMGNSVLPVTDVGRTQRLFGGSVPSTLFTHYRQELQALETVCGKYDVAQGRAPRNVQAASALALLLQQSGGRVRQRSRAVTNFVEGILKMGINLVSMFYMEDRAIRIVSQDKLANQTTISRNDVMMQRVTTDPLTGQQTVEQFVPDLDIIVTAGAETPTSRAYYSDLAVKLFQMGLIDDVAVLDTLQFPHWREILDRIKQRVQQQGQASPGAAAAPGTPPQGAPPQGEQGAPPQGGPVAPEQAAVQGAGAVQANPFQNIGGAAPQGGANEMAALVQALAALEQHQGR